MEKAPRFFSGWILHQEAIAVAVNYRISLGTSVSGEGVKGFLWVVVTPQAHAVKQSGNWSGNVGKWRRQQGVFLRPRDPTAGVHNRLVG